MAQSSRKIQEGLGHIKEAEKYMKTSFFKWSPDYDSAADQYNKAAVCFKVAKSYEQAKDGFKKTAECFEKNHQLYHAAKALTEAATICSEQKNYDETMDLMAKACCLYRENGTPDTACRNLVSTAKMIEIAAPLKAIQLFEEAAEIAENDEKFREAANHLNNASRLLIKSKEYLKATVVMKKQIEIYCKLENYAMAFNIILGQALVYLTEGDFVAAENCFKDSFDHPGFSSSDVAEALEQILEAYSAGDNKLLKTVTSKPIVSCQDIAIARLGKTLQAPDGGGGLDEYGTGDKQDETEVPNESLKKLEIKDEELDDGLC
eukprot:gene18237-20056_t